MIIALTGMPGSGKSSVGERLKNLLPGFDLFDTDEQIVIKEGMTINEIFSLKGEGYFRKIEAEVLKEILNGDNIIVSTGGGIVKSEENIRILNEKSVVFYLQTSPESLFERVKNNTDRPLLNTDDRKTKIKNLYEERKHLYEKSAKYVILTDNKTIEQISKEVIERCRP